MFIVQYQGQAFPYSTKAIAERELARTLSCDLFFLERPAKKGNDRFLLAFKAAFIRDDYSAAIAAWNDCWDYCCDENHTEHEAGIYFRVEEFDIDFCAHIHEESLDCPMKMFHY